MVQISNGRSKALRKKLEILRASAGAFRKRGFDGAGMREIAAAVEMTPGNLYYYFRNKEEILYFCQDYSLDRLLKIAKAIRSNRLPAPAKLHQLIVEQMKCMLDELHGSAAHIEFHALSEPLLRKIIAKRNQYEAILRGFLTDGIRQRLFRPCDEKMVSLAILGAINWSVRWYRPEGPQPPEMIGESFADFLIHGLMQRSTQWKTPRRKRKTSISR